MPVRSLSVQPLALVVITNNPFGGKPIVHVPACDHQNNPIIVPVVELNFGEAQVEFQPKLPQTKLVETPVVVLELKICKDLVNDWNEVQSSLAYLGLPIPEMRKDAVIEAWSISPYDKHRWKSKHDYADYSHGFCKVRLAVADDILKRSGVAGIFLAPKTPDKKRDLWHIYSLIQIPGKPLDEVICMVKDVPKTVGVVECAANYAIHVVRSKILPQRTPFRRAWFNLILIGSSSGDSEIKPLMKT